MLVRCTDCSKVYDDESAWTICPHNSLSVAHDAHYCRYHDLYNCTLGPCGIASRFPASDKRNHAFRRAAQLHSNQRFDKVSGYGVESS